MHHATVVFSGMMEGWEGRTRATGKHPIKVNYVVYGLQNRVRQIVNVLYVLPSLISVGRSHHNVLLICKQSTSTHAPPPSFPST